MNNDQFVHLHVHTEYSLLDGACKISDLFDRVKEMGQTAIAITDHGVMYGAVQFFDAAKAAGIKPIIGCEVYVANRSRFDKVNKMDWSNHLILLCKDQTGYSNLIKMVSAGFTEGFYRKPRIDKELLEKHHEGLICLSGCLAGEVARYIASDEYNKAVETALWYKNLFGDDYYIELQDHNLQDDRKVLPQLIRLARENNIQMVATNDAHYITKEDSRVQEILTCIQTQKTLYDQGHLAFETDEFYLKTTEEMRSIFSIVPEACENTIRIAEKCNFEFHFGETKLPVFEAPNGEDNQKYFERLCWEGLARRYETVTDELKDRLTYEIGVIKQMGYTNYFLIVFDYINYAKNHGIPVGPGRGSGAGSLAAYCVGITDIDPIKHNLIFERFLNPERVSMPDFDVDFCYERRQEVIDYVNRKYGSDHVAQIVTFGTMAARLAVRDVGRVMGADLSLVDKVAKLVPTELHMTLKKALEESQDLKNLYDSDRTVKDIIDTSIKIEGMPRHTSTHAAGVVIAPAPADTFVPLATNDGLPVTQYNMVEIERLGLLKMDFLGLRTLTVIRDAEKSIQKHTPDFSIDKIDYGDTETLEMLCRGETEGVFQLESGGIRQVVVDMEPKNLEDVIAVIALYRPGPMDSIPDYINNRRNPHEVQYATPELAHILDVTNGVIIYQEQVMQICRELAGFSYGQADNVRRAMSKKKMSVMAAERKRFVYGSTEKGQECPGCVGNGISEQAANEIYDKLIKFAEYAFNKAHAACYAYIAFQTAYLRCHYPKEFMAALLTSVLGNTDKVAKYSAECTKLGIKVLPPAINASMKGFSVDGDDIRYGMSAVKNVGDDFIRAIISERDREGSFTSLYQFCERLAGTGKLNKSAIECLIKAGAFDSLEFSRRGMISDLAAVISSVNKERKANVAGQLSLFSMQDEATGTSHEYHTPELEEYDRKELLKMEKDVAGIYLSGHPLKEHMKAIAEAHCVTAQDLLDKDSGLINKEVWFVGVVVETKTVYTKSSEQMAFVHVEDLSGKAEVVVFASAYAKYSALLIPDTIIAVQGRVTQRDSESEPKLIAKTICDIAVFDPNMAKRTGQTAAPKPTGKGHSKRHGLWLHIQSRNGEQMQKVKNLLENIFNGDMPTYFYCEEEKRTFLASKTMYANCCPALISELEHILGKDCVKVVD